MAQHDFSTPTPDGGIDHALIDAAWADADGLAPESPVVPPMRETISADVADSFPGYDLLREIHRGGQGVVYQALQRSTRRKVAIKVMREGPFASTRERARFEREVQILGALQHPNIVAIHDSGECRGSFYYVMDYIAGKPLDEYVNARRQVGLAATPPDSTHKPQPGSGPRKAAIDNSARTDPEHVSAPSTAVAGTRQPGSQQGGSAHGGSRTRGAGRRASQEFLRDTLCLFSKVCEAVHSAHLHGIIHRDLKPANIRVDERGEPFVLDFGLAKVALSAADPTGHPHIVTATGQFIGSLPWASPEQTGGSPDRIDIRSDVYSLGVILYQLLTGRFPYSVTGQPRQVLENIATMEPERPSSVDGRIGDEVETVVLKCLQKDANRRYQSAGELGRDIRHYLAGEPIEAKRDSAMYVIRKAMVRRRRQLIMGAVVLCAVATTAVGDYVARRHANAQHEIYERETATREAQHEALTDVLAAETCLARRTEMPRAMSLVTRALQKSPDMPRAVLVRGRLHAAEALNAALDVRHTYIQAALTDLEFVESRGDESLVTQALASRRELLTLIGRHDDAAAARRALGQRPPAADAQGGAAIGPLYDPATDPLRVAAPPADSPEQAHLLPDYNAELLRIMPAPMADLHPLRALGYGQYITELLFDSMYVFDWRSRCIANAAMVASEELMADGVSILVRLRPGLRWSDGAALTASDVVFTWEHAVPETKRQGKRLEQVDELSVRLAMTTLLPPASRNLDFAILPRHVFDALKAEAPDAPPEEIEKRFHEQFSRQPLVCNGPYRLAKPPVPERIELERRADYSGQQGYFARIVFEATPDRARRIAMLAEGRALELGLTCDDFRWDVNGASFERHIKVLSSGWEYAYVCWNLNAAHTVLADEHVRRALAAGVDLDRLLLEEYGGLYRRATSIWSATEWGAAASQSKPIAFDPALADRLLNEAGWRWNQGRTVRSQNDRELRFSLMVPREAQAFVRIVERLREWWSAIGIGVTLESIPKSEFDVRLRERQFEAMASAVIINVDPSQDRRRWHTTGDRNYAGYSNEDVDRWFDQAATTADPAEQARFYRRIQDRVYSDQPYLFLWQKPTMWAFDKRLRGVGMSAGRGPIGFFPGPRAWWTPLSEGSP